MNIFEITLDVDKHGNHESVNMRQGDLMGTTISATLRDHDVPMEGGDYDAFFCMTLPDRKTYYRTEAEYADGVVSVVVDEQYAAQVPGSTNNAYFELWDGEELKYTTDSFVVRIKASAMDGKPAESYDSRVEEIMSEMREVIDEETVNEVARQEAEAAREAAESIRATTFETNEAARESTFTANEAERESTAAANEQARADLFTANEDERAETFSENEDERSQTFETNESDRASTFASNEAERIATFSDNEDERSDTFSENEQSREDTFTDNEATRAATFLASESQRSSTFTANEARREATYSDIIQYPKAEVETTSAGQILHVTWKNEGGEYSTDLTVNDATSIVVTGDTFSIPVDHDGVCTADGTARFYFSGWVGSKRVPCSASLTSGPDSRFRVQFTNATSTAEGVVRVTYTAGTTYDDLVDVCTFTLSCNSKSYVHRISATAPKAGKNAGFGTVSASVTNTGDTPSVEVTTSGTDDAKNIDFAFSGIQGADGVSPTVSITDSTSSHTVTITDSTGDHSYTVPTYADEEQAREDAWDTLESTVTDARDEALSAAALARNVNGNRLAKTLSGTVLTADDAYAAPPIDAVIYGASTQDGTPTPSAPVPIESVDALTLHAAGKNLFDLSTVTKGIRNGNTNKQLYYNDGTLYNELSIGQHGYWAFDFPLSFPVNTQITVSFDIVLSGTNSSNSVLVCLRDSTGTSNVSNEVNVALQDKDSSSHYDVTLTVNQGKNLRDGFLLLIQARNTGNYISLKNVVLAIGSAAIAYEPYVGTATSIDLQGNQLCSLSDDIYDELVLTPNGTGSYQVSVIQRVGRVDIGTFTWVPTSAVGSEHFRFTYRLSTLAIGAKLLCSSLTPATYTEVYNHVIDNSIAAHPNVAQLEVYASGYTDATAFKQAMSGATLHYALATPVTIDLGTVTLPALPAPDMTVWASGGSAQPSLDVTYERDANMAESAINADVDGLHDDVTELRTDTDGLLTSTSGLRTDTDDLRTDTDGLLANVAQIPSMLSQQLTAGAAGGITGGGPTDSAAWVERVTGGGDASDGPATIGAIRGRTVRWNQLCKTYTTTVTERGCTFTFARDGTVAISGTPTSTGSIATVYNNYAINIPAGHKFLLRGNRNIDWHGGASVFCVTQSDGNDTYNTGAILTRGTSGKKLYVSFYVYASELPINSGMTFRPEVIDLTVLYGAGNEPSTVAEFEALYPEPYYPYDAGSLLPVRMEGVETTGRNLFDVSLMKDQSAWNHVPVAAPVGATLTMSTDYAGTELLCYFTSLGGNQTSANQVKRGQAITQVVGSEGVVEVIQRRASGTDSFANYEWQIESGSTDTDYEPHWQQTREIPASTYFPNGMRSAGSVYDELTADAAVTRVGAVTLDGSQSSLRYVVSVNSNEVSVVTITGAGWAAAGLPAVANGYNVARCAELPTMTTAYNTWTGKGISGWSDNSAALMVAPTGDNSITTEAEFKAWLAQNPLHIHYTLATPITTPIDPPLNLAYRAEQGGTERITHTDPTAPPTLDVTYGSTADGIRDRVLSVIAPVENGRASANYAVGSYLIHDGQLCKVTTAIASGEAIGTNVTATTVMAEVIALTQ